MIYVLYVFESYFNSILDINYIWVHTTRIPISSEWAAGSRDPVPRVTRRDDTNIARLRDTCDSVTTTRVLLTRWR